MFGLPTFTWVVLAIIPAAWVLYTAIFYARTRDWEREDETLEVTE